MKITIVLNDGSRHKARLPYPDATHVVLTIPCPNKCPLETDETLKVSGTGIQSHNHDTYFADAVAMCCKKRIGKIETKLDTLFGVAEDAEVLSGKYGRVY